VAAASPTDAESLFSGYKRGMTVDEIRRLIGQERGALEASGVTALYVFGSVARGEAGDKSDVDLIVDYSSDSSFDLIDLADVQQRLAARLEAKVDVVTRKGLHRRIRDDVLREAVRVM
jgi:predicted nucleotidyltransferase